MATYLLTWNPARWPWDDLPKCIAQIEKKGYWDDSWGTGSTRKILPGDRVFLMKLGDKRRGLVGSGWATSTVYEDQHWDEDLKAKGRLILSVDVRFDTLLDPSKDMLPREWLVGEIYSKMHWTPQGSGVTIPEDVAEKLEEDWARFLNKPVTRPAKSRKRKSTV